MRHAIQTPPYARLAKPLSICATSTAFEMEALKHLDKELPLDNDSQAKQGAEEMAVELRSDWKDQTLRNHFFTDGITNRILAVWGDNPSDRILFRIFGRNTELLVDREAEIETMRKLSREGLAPPVYATFKNGLVYGFVPGSVLDVESVRTPEIGELIASRCAELHCLPCPENSAGPVCIVKTTDWISKLPEGLEDQAKAARLSQFPSKDQLLADMAEFKVILEALKSPIVFAHNDLLLKNIILDESHRAVHFIDFEYGGPNYQAVELGNHFDEWAGVDDIDFNRFPNEEEQKRWLAKYAQFWEERKGEKLDLEVLYLQVSFPFSASTSLLPYLPRGTPGTPAI